MNDDRDPLLEAAFAQAWQPLADDGFPGEIMNRIRRRRRRVIGGRIAIAAVVIGFEYALAFPLQNSVGLLTQALATPLLDLGDHWLVDMLSPLNSIAGLIGIGLIGLQLLYRKLMR